MSKKDFSIALKYVEARPRSQRRKGAEARVSGISVGGSGVSATDLSLLNTNLISVTNNFTALKDLFDSMFEKDSENNIHAKLPLWSSGGITAGGVGSGGSGGGGVSYNRLDSWADYSADKAGYVLSAALGKDLDNRVSALANAGYITASYLAPYALRSEIPSLVGYATQSWVGENYLSKSGGKLVYSGAQGIEAERTDGAPSHIMFIGLVNGTSRQLGGFGMNGYNDPVYVNPNGIRHKVLTAENYSDYALSKNGGTIYGPLCVSMYGWNNQLVLNGVDSNAGIEFRYSNTYVAALSCAQGNPYWHMGETAYPILHSGNYSDYALSKNGGTIYGGIGALKIKRSGTGNSYIEYQNNTETLGYIGFRVKGAPAYMDDATYIQYDLLHLYNYRDYVVATNGNSTVNGSITATSFIGNLTGNASAQSIPYSNRDVNLWDIDNRTARYFALSESAQNTPSGVYALGSILMEYSWDVNAGAQLLSYNAGNNIFYRSRWNGVFKDWREIAFTDSNVASATKLQTPRTIWGQSFDGTQDITGALTAPSITANSLTIGGATITYDSVNEALCINGNMYALGGITAGGAGISAYTSLEARVARLEQQLNIS